MLKKLCSIPIFFWIACSAINAQILTATPSFPTADDQVTIIYDATQGTAGLNNCACDVYLHTGVITAASTSPSDWKYVVTTWGQANAAWKMTPVPGQPNKYSYVIGPSIRGYYNVPIAEQIQKMAFVFRNATGTLEGKATGGTDIFYDVYAENIALTTSLTSPGLSNLEVALGQSIQVEGVASSAATLSIYQDGVLLTSAANTTTLSYAINATSSGAHEVHFIANNGQNADTSSFTYTATYRLDLTSPAQSVVLTQIGANISVNANAYITSSIQMFVDGALSAQNPNSTTFSANINVTAGGTHEVVIAAAYQAERDTARFVYVVPGNVTVLDPPAGAKDGITYQPGGDGVHLQLYAPNKQVIFVLGDFNNWQPSLAYQMNRSVDGNTWWLAVSGLTPGEKYGFQYLVDGALRIADPYSTVVLNANDDPFIPEVTYPNLHAYPTGKTTGIVSLLEPGAPVYNWQVNNFTAPPKEKLVVYELLLRDFLDRHDYATLIDTLDYLDRLGINAIELMPVNEFEGNLSWGYNPSHHMALDKYYGTIDDFKRFVDACHARGIAVILDVVYNHAFSQSPLAQLYWDAANFRPAPDNPWLNVTARHPFSVGYDFNHESAATRKFVDQVMTYWLEEFRVDGFRFDLSKGFTQVNSGSNVDLWGQYDASRIAILKHYADVVWAANEDAYVILEHFAANSEEIELHSYGNGMLFWSGAGVHNQFLEAAMGYNSDLNGALHTSRGWTQPNLVAYMESHDEERMMFKNLQFGNGSGGYNVKNFVTGLQRVELASAFFYPLPGPKMLWQFGELGYDFPINYCPDGTIAEGCRVANKPIRWDYAESPNRRRIYDVKRALIELKTTYDVFSTTNFQTFLQGPTKRIHLLHPEMDVAVVGNFNVTPDNVQSPFPHTGWWYEYFSGDSLQVTNTGTALPLVAGEYRLYTTTRLNAPPGGYITSDTEIERLNFNLTLAPNPATDAVQIGYILPESAFVQIEVLDMQGRRVLSLPAQQQGPGAHQVAIDTPFATGIYLVKCSVNGQAAVSKLVVERK